ncbi:hypothetical protein [Loigolactobacillus binensis]|uniref:Uncharacterized protein n=1 Tax=Loigolactobacillus binensis TaxID=2559922 RepID=A0ABW3EGT0_9LACO|nr:hypothetical protein [Loigolactobacillus binensis]
MNEFQDNKNWLIINSKKTIFNFEIADVKSDSNNIFVRLDIPIGLKN